MTMYLDITQYVQFVYGWCDSKGIHTRLKAHCYACNIVWIHGKVLKIVGIIVPCTFTFFSTCLICVLEPVGPDIDLQGLSNILQHNCTLFCNVRGREWGFKFRQ